MRTTKHKPNFDWGIHNLNDSYIDSEIEKLTANGFDKPSIELICSFEIVANTLSYDFIQREFCIENFNTDFNKIKDPYFYHLADLIWELRDYASFKEYILSEGRSKKKEAIYSELYFLYLISKISESIEFNMPTGVKGHDFDLIAQKCKFPDGLLFDSLKIEVKSPSKSFKDQNQVTNALNKARKQLPRNNAGAVCFLFQETCFPFLISQQELDAAIIKYIKSTDRISFVVYLWIEKGEMEEQKSFLMSKYKILNKNGEFPLGFFESTVRTERPFMIRNSKMTQVI